MNYFITYTENNGFMDWFDCFWLIMAMILDYLRLKRACFVDFRDNF